MRTQMNSIETNHACNEVSVPLNFCPLVCDTKALDTFHMNSQ